MASGSNKESKAGASDDEAVSSPGLDVAAAPPVWDDRDHDDTAALAAVYPPAAPAPAAASTRPYYECVFCKRGFTTAQALGGHMNIHRRDRGKPGPRDATPTGITSVSRNVECYNQYRHLAAASYPPAPPPPPATAPTSSSGSFAMMYYRSTASGAAATSGVDVAAVSPSSASPRELSLFGAAARDHDLHLGLACHGRGGEGGSRAPEGSERPTGEPERELDLELRLGRRPRH